jgi:hypothetical protein
MKQILLILFALLLTGGCSDDSSSVEVTPELFLGKWQEIARGNDTYPELPPDDGHIIEFLPDSTYLAVWGNGNVSTRSYRIDTEFVYLGSGIAPDSHTYRYSFTGTNILRLDVVYGIVQESMGTPTFNIYERLKNNEP